MNNKQIKNLLRQRADEVKLNNNPSTIIERVESTSDFKARAEQATAPQVVLNNAPKRSKGFAFKVAIPALAGALGIVIVFISVILPLFNKQTNPPITARAEDVFYKEIFALGNVLSHLEDETVAVSLTEGEFRQICGECVNYLLTGDAFLQKDNMTSSVYKNTGEEYAEYEYVARVRFIDSGSFTTEYVTYYNEAKRQGETLVSGIMIIGQTEYRMEGEREQEDDEVESELRIYLGEDSYISVSNETEINENEFTYEWVQGGNVVKGVSLEIEYENGLKQTEIEITENGRTQGYEFSYHAQTITCEYEDDDREEEFIIYIHDEYYLFVHEDYEVRVNK